MTFLLLLKKLHEKEYESKQKNKIEKELPYFITIVTLLATSGFGPYFIFKKMKNFELLPTIRLESDKILKRMQFLGLDPLTAMKQTKDRPSSKALGDFLSGYASSIQSGGNVMNYLKSKMKSTFDLFAESEKQQVETVKALIEAYMTLQVVVLAVFVIFAAVGNNSLSSTPTDESIDYTYYIMLFPLIIAIGFLKIAQGVALPKTREINIKKFLLYGLPVIAVSLFLIASGIFSDFGVNPYIIGSAFIAISLWPALKFEKIYLASLDAESATPQILRDITESRKVGLSPEKCVINACNRKNFDLFNPIANSISNKLQWGVPIENIFTSFKKQVTNFKVLISFRILFEIISSGGGNVETLDSLAETSERIYTIEKSKQEMLKPYVMIGFMLIGITGFITLIVIDTFSDIELTKTVDEVKRAEISRESNSSIEAFSLIVVVQSWITGLFLGKIITGNYSGGFKYSIILVIISLTGVVVIQSSIFNLASLF